MKITITQTNAGYELVNPWDKRHVIFNSILQAVSYCRNHGLVFSLAF